MATILEDVDICVTCISDQPPQLPLREELPSLGVEVVYRAKGQGVKASQQEVREKVQHYRQQETTQDLTPTPITHALFGSPNLKHIRAKLAERKRTERMLKVPHALTYESYTAASPTIPNEPPMASNHIRTRSDEAKQEKDEQRGGGGSNESQSLRQSPPTPEHFYHDLDDGVVVDAVLGNHVHHPSTVSSTSSYSHQGRVREEEDKTLSTPPPDNATISTTTTPPDPLHKDDMRAAVVAPVTSPTLPDTPTRMRKHRNHQSPSSPSRKHQPAQAHARIPSPNHPVLRAATATRATGAPNQLVPTHETGNPTTPTLPVSTPNLDHDQIGNQNTSDIQNDKSGPTNSTGAATGMFHQYYPMAEELLCPAMRTTELRPKQVPESSSNNNDPSTNLPNFSNFTNNNCQSDFTNTNCQAPQDDEEMMDLLQAAASSLTSFGSWCNPIPNQGPNGLDSPKILQTPMGNHYMAPISPEGLELPNSPSALETNPETESRYDQLYAAPVDTFNAGNAKRAVPLVTHLPPPPPPPPPPPQQQKQEPNKEQHQDSLSVQKADKPETKRLTQIGPQPKPNEKLPPWLNSMSSSPLFIAAKQKHLQQQQKQQQEEQKGREKEEAQQEQEQPEEEGSKHPQSLATEKDTQRHQGKPDKLPRKWPPPSFTAQTTDTSTSALAATLKNTRCHRPSQDQADANKRSVSSLFVQKLQTDKALEKDQLAGKGHMEKEKKTWKKKEGISYPIFQPLKNISSTNRASAKGPGKIASDTSPLNNNRTTTQTPPPIKRTTTQTPSPNNRTITSSVEPLYSEKSLASKDNEDNALPSSSAPPSVSPSTWKSRRIVTTQSKRNPEEEKEEKELDLQGQNQQQPVETKTPSNEQSPKESTPRSPSGTPATEPDSVSPVQFQKVAVGFNPIACPTRNKASREKLSLRELLARDRAPRGTPATPVPSPPDASSVPWGQQQLRSPQPQPKQSPLSLSEPSFSSASPSPLRAPGNATQSTPPSANAAVVPLKISASFGSRVSHHFLSPETKEGDNTESSPSSSLVPQEEQANAKRKLHGLLQPSSRTDELPKTSPRTARLSIPTLIPVEDVKDKRREAKRNYGRANLSPTNSVQTTINTKPESPMTTTTTNSLSKSPLVTFHEAKKTSGSMPHSPPSSPLSSSRYMSNKYRAKPMYDGDSQHHHVPALVNGGRGKAAWTPTPSPTPTAASTPDRTSSTSSSLVLTTVSSSHAPPSVVEGAPLTKASTHPTVLEEGRPAPAQLEASSSVNKTGDSLAPLSATTKGPLPRRSPGRVARMVELYSKGQ